MYKKQNMYINKKRHLHDEVPSRQRWRGDSELD